ncbi:DUF1295 domain-containing protein [Nocardioides sp.]|uniref:DUF1295 domain-containing protein n=1 Tax=Nocardioides sp. TaxID=35761 RepID=UPI00351733F3
MSKGASLARVGLVYAVALAAATAWLVLGPDTGRLWLDALLADLVATVVVFGFSRYFGNSSCYDAYWSVLPPYLAAYWWLASDTPGVDDARSALLLIVVAVWAIRLTGNWIHDWPGMHHEDWRYPMLRDGAGRWGVAVDFSGIHLVPTLIVFGALVPAWAVLDRPGGSLNWLDAVALVVGLGAPVLQFVADAQMRAVIRERQPGQAMHRGLWAWSRHPNYFGEVSFWFALSFFAIAGSPGDAWWLLIGPVVMLLMFEFASIPMMDQRSLERRPSYQQIIDTTPRLILLPPGTFRSRQRGARVATGAS